MSDEYPPTTLAEKMAAREAKDREILAKDGWAVEGWEDGSPTAIRHSNGDVGTGQAALNTLYWLRMAAMFPAPEYDEDDDEEDEDPWGRGR